MLSPICTCPPIHARSGNTFDARPVLDRARAAQYRDQLERHLRGELGTDEFRALRLQNGWYIQRHAPMLRVAVPYGELSSRQLRQLARIARDYDVVTEGPFKGQGGYGHFTTRQNLQYNWIPLEKSAEVMELLADVDMHGIQTSGNCIRNITSDAFAGIAPRIGIRETRRINVGWGIISPFTRHPVQIAMEARERGLTVITVSSHQNARVAAAKHSSGKKLSQIAHIAIDNCVPPEDALVEVGQIERAVMCGAIVTDEPCAVEEESDRQILEANVVQHLVEASLQEGGVDRGDRLEALRRETRGKGDRVLLRSGGPAGWSEPIEITAGGGDIYKCGVTVDGRGAVWVVWSQNTRHPSPEANFEILARAVIGGKPTAEINLSAHAGSDVHPTVTTAADGRVWCAWQGVRDGAFRILERHQAADGSWTAERIVSPQSRNCWTPAIAAVVSVNTITAVATITASRISARTERRMRIFARDRYLNVDFASRKLSVVRSDPAAGAAGFKSEEFAWDDHDSLAGEHAAFAASILDGAPVLVDAAAGRRALAAALAVGEAMDFSRDRMHASGLLPGVR